MNFSCALEWLKLGKKLTREEWKVYDKYIEIQPIYNHFRTNITTILIKTMTRTIGLWLISQEDVLANDWETVG